jgi:hypothetical protein
MKRLVYATLLGCFALTSGFKSLAIGPTVGLTTNNRIVRYVDGSRPLTFEGPFPISGIETGQMLVGMDVQPNTGTLYALGYSPSDGRAQLYTINPRTLTATAVRTSPFRLRLGPTGSAAFSFDPTMDPSRATIRVWGQRGYVYRLDANTGEVMEVTDPGIRTTTLDGPYSGTVFLADGTIRNNGFVNADASDTPPILARANEGVQTTARGTLNGSTGAYAYPNPAVSTVRIMFQNEPRGRLSLEVLDLNGRIMNSRMYTTGTPAYDLDVSTLPIGLYTVRVLQDGMLTDEIKLVRRSE